MAQQREIEELKSRLRALEQRVNELEAEPKGVMPAQDRPTLTLPEKRKLG